MRFVRGSFVLLMLVGLAGCVTTAAPPSQPQSSSPAVSKSPPGSSSAVGWQTFPHAFASQDHPLAGPALLVRGPGACFTAFGQDAAGAALYPAAWTAGGECTQVTAVAGFGAPINSNRSGGFELERVIDAISTRDGGILALTRHYRSVGSTVGYQTRVSIGPSAHHLKPVAEFGGAGPDGQSGPDSVVATDRGYAAAGYVGATPTGWTSADGTSWQATTLPGPARTMSGLELSFRHIAISVGPAGQLVVVECYDTSVDPTVRVVDAWHSEDGGITWSAGVLPTLTGLANLSQVLFDGHDYVAIGYSAPRAAGPEAHPLVLRSADGSTWTRDASVDRTGAWALAEAAVLPDGSLVVVAANDLVAPSPSDPATADDNGVCASVWIESHGAWTRDDIACHGVPRALLVLADGRVVAATGHYLFIHSAYPGTP